jgi:hypothetical protein
MPKIFSIIDKRMNEHYAGKRTTDIVSGLPGGLVEYGENWVQSTPITVRFSLPKMRPKQWHDPRW